MSASKNKSDSQTQTTAKTRDEFLRLTEDRKQIDEYRKEVPEEKRKENDDLAFLLQLFSKDDRPPQDIRNEFEQVVRKKREVFDKKMQKDRDDFNNSERKKRDDFLQRQTDLKTDFSKQKKSREESKKFFQDLDSSRGTFFADERDKRAEFESNFRERRKNFDDFIRSKQDWFNQEYRLYSKRFEDAKKEKSLEQKKLEDDLKKGKQKPINPIGSGSAPDEEN